MCKLPTGCTVDAVVWAITSMKATICSLQRLHACNICAGYLSELAYISTHICCARAHVHIGQAHGLIVPLAMHRLVIRASWLPGSFNDASVRVPYGFYNTISCGANTQTLSALTIRWRPLDCEHVLRCVKAYNPALGLNTSCSMQQCWELSETDCPEKC